MLRKHQRSLMKTRIWQINSLKSRIALQVARKIAPCNMALLRGSPCKNRPLEFLKIAEFLHTFCVEEVIHKMNKKR